jgi:N4-gp56 family major capsid protein
MAINYAQKYASAALEAFALDSITTPNFSSKYDWTDVKTVNVFTNATVALSAYTRTAGYGTPTTIDNTVQAMTVTGDVGFSANLDKLDMASTAGSLAAGEFLAMQMRQVVTPYVDKYNFLALTNACPTGQISASAAITSANAYTSFLTGNATLDESLVPKGGRIVFASPAYLNNLKVDSNYVKASDLAQGQIMFNGQVGAIDGVPVVAAPDALMNATDKHTDFIIVHRDAVAAPVKLADFKVYSDVPGWSGSRVEGRIVFDLFLLTALNKGIYIHKHA